MNRWAMMLADAPPTLQRLIARRQRISLPRSCSAIERVARLRASLCHARTVREIYFALPPEAQAALQELRAEKRGLAPDELGARFGPLRPWSQIAADIAPRSLSEQLVLLGLLLPRPAMHRHPTRFLLPPEVRAWLPRPLSFPDHGPAPAPALPLALRAARTVLLALAERPLPVRADGSPRKTSLRLLAARLALPEDAASVLCRWLWPLLLDLGLLAPHGADAALAPAGQRFLARPAREQLVQLRSAWVRAPRPEGWVCELGVALRGLDWPLLRRRLLAWAAALPADRLLEPAILHAALADALGPLADAQTHGFRHTSPGRTPWQPKSAAAVWEAAMRGPLAWMGALDWASDERPVADDEGGGRNHKDTKARRSEDEVCTLAIDLDQSQTICGISVSSASSAFPSPTLTDEGRRTNDEGISPSALARSTFRKAGRLTAIRLEGAQKRKTPIGRGWTFLNVRGLMGGGAKAKGRSVLTLQRWVFRPHADEEGLPLIVEEAEPWQCDAPGEVRVPRDAFGGEALGLLPFARFAAADAACLTYRITRRTLAEATRAGHHVSALRSLLQRQAGPVPPTWDVLLGEIAPAVQIVHAAVVTSADPAVLSRAAGARSVRRYLGARLAPGIALVEPGRAEGLVRTLRRRNLAVEVRGDPQLAPPAELTPAECAVLLAVCADYRALVPPEGLPPAVGPLEDRLRAALPRTLAASESGSRLLLSAQGRSMQAEQMPGTAALETPPPAEEEATSAADAALETQAHPTSYLAPLRTAIARQRLVRIRYRSSSKPPSERIIRPLLLEHHADRWYLQAYCTLAQAERLFRLDRIEDLVPTEQRLGRAAPARRTAPPPATLRRPARRTTALDTGLFPPPPPPPPGSPLVRVWLVDDLTGLPPAPAQSSRRDGP